MGLEDIHYLIFGGNNVLGHALACIFSQKHMAGTIVGSRENNFDLPLDCSYCCVDMLNGSQYNLFCDGLFEKSKKLKSIIFMQRFRGADYSLDSELKVSVKSTQTLLRKISEANLECLSMLKKIVIVGTAGINHAVLGHDEGYVVGKVALMQLVKSYAYILGIRNICVNMCSPSIYKKGKEHLDTKFMKEIIPLKRVPEPTEIASVLAFLCSDDASFITGQNLIVDGGLSLLLPYDVFKQTQEMLKD